MQANPGFFISIGGGENQLPLIEEAIASGLHVITVDKNPIAPGFQKSQIKIIESTHEYRKVLSAISQIPLTGPIQGVGCRSYGKSCYSASYIANKLKIKGSPPDSIRFLLDKKDYLQRLYDLGVKVPRIYEWTSFSDIKKSIPDISFPIICKPVQGSGKKGIYFFSNENDLMGFNDKAKINFANYIFQEYIYGDEITALGMVGDKDFHLLSVSDKVTTPYPPFLEKAHILPSNHSNVLGEIERVLNYISKYFSLSFAPLLGEFKITPQGDLYLMEIAAEVGGEFLADKLIPKHYSTNYFSLLLKLLTKGESQIKRLSEAKNKQSLIYFTTPNENSLSVIEPASFLPGVGEEAFFQKDLLETDTKVSLSMGNKSRSYVMGIQRNTALSSGTTTEWLESIERRLGIGYK